MIKRTIRKLLQDTGRFRCVGDAEDGSEAFGLIERLRPDVVITDITMPAMDGLELIAAFTGKRDAPEFVIVSGYDDFSYIQEAIRSGVADYLLKPIKPDEFFATMSRIEARLRDRDAAGKKQPGPEWLPAAEQEAARIAEAAWLLKSDEVKERLEAFRLHISEAGAAAQAVPLWIHLAELVSMDLARRGGGGLAPDALTRIRSAAHGDEALRIVREAAEDAMLRIRQSRNWGNHRQIRSAIEEVHARFQDPSLSLQSLAEKHGMSSAYFSRSFKTETGTTFVQYVSMLRMEKARELLAHPDKSTADAAKESGFSDYPHFAKAFKQRYGVSPSEYKKLLGVT